MRRLSIPRPFTGGMRTDAADYAISLNESAYAQDLIYPEGVARQRWGWAYDNPVFGGGPFRLCASGRNQFPLTGGTVSFACVASTSANSPGQIITYSGGTAVINPGVVSSRIPRCFYNGETIFCAQDGEQPIIRFAGVASANSVTLNGGTNSWKMTSGRTTLGDPAAALTFSSGQLKVGQFVNVFFPSSTGQFALNPEMSVRVVSPGTGGAQHEVAVDSVRNYSISADTVVSTQNIQLSPFGHAWPAVQVYGAGSATRTASTAGVESTWAVVGADLSTTSVATTSKGSLSTNGDSLLIVNPTAGGRHEIASVISYTATSGTTGVIRAQAELTTQTNAAYRIMRGLPFKDACVYKGSLVGTGFARYPNRVYVGPPGWNLSIPPGATEPFDPTVPCGYSNSTVTGFTDLSDFTMDFYDVPSRYDTDPVVAVLPSNGPILVLKRNSVYGLFGAWPSFDDVLIANGSGCIDLRSAMVANGNAYWAGPEGIYTYRGGQIQNLTEGRIGKEWRALMSGYTTGTSSVTCGSTSRHLFVSAQGLDGARTTQAINGPDPTNNGPTSRVFIYDLQTNTWSSRMSNIAPTHLGTVRVPSEQEAVFSVDGTTSGRVIDLAPTVNGVTVQTNRGAQTGIPATSLDEGSTTFPRLLARTGTALAQNMGVAGESKMLDMTIHANIYNPFGVGADLLTPTTIQGDRLESKATAGWTHDGVAADTQNRIDRFKFRVNKSGRLHQIWLDFSPTTSDLNKVEIPEITMSFRDTRGGT